MIAETKIFPSIAEIAKKTIDPGHMFVTNCSSDVVGDNT